jgi:hypothetical protein
VDLCGHRAASFPARCLHWAVWGDGMGAVRLSGRPGVDGQAGAVQRLGAMRPAQPLDTNLVVD